MGDAEVFHVGDEEAVVFQGDEAGGGEGVEEEDEGEDADEVDFFGVPVALDETVGTGGGFDEFGRPEGTTVGGEVADFVAGTRAALLLGGVVVFGGLWWRRFLRWRVVRWFRFRQWGRPVGAGL